MLNPRRQRANRESSVLRWLSITGAAGGLSIVAGCVSALPPVDGGTPVAGAQATKGTQGYALKAAGYNRTYVLHTPPSFSFGVAQPVVLLMHGTAGDGLSFLHDNGWAVKADVEGFIAVAPDALGTFPDAPVSLIGNPSAWSATQFSFGGATTNFDVLFFDALLADLSAKLGFNVERVFIAGHSGGGSMGFVLASERSGRVAALGADASHWIGIGPAPEPPTPTIFIVGTQDSLAPLTGGSGLTPSIDFTLARWGLALGCTGSDTTSDDDRLRIVDYSGCRNGTPFQAIFINGQGHAWPGGNGLNEIVLGPDTGFLNGTDTMWSFFVANGAR